MMDEVIRRLGALGVQLPTPPRPLGAYRAVIEAGEMLHVSMQGPLLDGRFVHTGLLGRDVTIDEGRKAAELAVLNALAQIHEHLGRFERIRQIVRLEDMSPALRISWSTRRSSTVLPSFWRPPLAKGLAMFAPSAACATCRATPLSR